MSEDSYISNPNPYRLSAPAGYWTLKPAEKAVICNGCGAKSALIDFVPDTIWGLSISEACDIHDYSWFVCKPTVEEFRHWNRVFLDNMLQIIEKDSANWFMRWLRQLRAFKYYQAVDTVGWKIFNERR